MKNCCQYLEKIMISSKSLYQIGSQEFMVDFKGCDRQFDWLEVSPVYGKIDKHLISYDSYNDKCAA